MVGAQAQILTPVHTSQMETTTKIHGSPTAMVSPVHIPATIIIIIIITLLVLSLLYHVVALPILRAHSQGAHS